MSSAETEMAGDDSSPQTDHQTHASSRRALLLGAVGAAAVAGAVATGLSTPAGALPGDDVTIDDTTTGGGGTTTLAATTLKAALEDWGGQVYNVKAYGAVGNGTADDTSAIAAAQSAAGAGCVYFPLGTYLVDGLTVTTAGQTFKLEAGATLLAKPGIAGAVVKVSASSVNLLGPGIIDGNATNQTGTTGLDCVQFVSGGDDGLVQGLVIQNAAWIGIETESVNRTRIVLNRVLNCAQAGVSCNTSTSIDGPTIVGNQVFLTGTSVFSGINVQSTSTTLLFKGPVVTDNRVDVAAGLGIQVSNCSGARVEGNRATGPAQSFSVVGGTDNVVIGNVALPTGSSVGIEIGSAHSICVGNAINHTGTGPGIHADNPSGTNVVISNNKITGAEGAGITVGSYDHITINGNVITQSSSASPVYAVIQIAPSGPGLVIISDNICDASGGSIYGIWLENLISTSIQTSIHDNAIAGIPSIPMAAAIRLSGAGTVTDLLVHDNTVSSGTSLYTTSAGITLGNNVLFSHNIIVGVPLDNPSAGLGVSLISTLPASGTPYTNPGPFKEIIYLYGGKLAGTGLTQGVTKNGLVLAPAAASLKVPITVSLDPGESFTVYYTTAPTAHKDVRG